MSDRAVKVGDLVMYMMEDGYHPGEERPAFVVQTWSPSTANLAVFVDGANDITVLSQALDQQRNQMSTGLLWKTSRQRGTSQQPGTWRYPDETPEQPK